MSIPRILIIVLIALVMLEVTLRVFVDRSDLYAGLEHYPALNAKHFESKFLERYAHKRLEKDAFDPQLGWDYDRQNDRIRGDAHYSIAKPAGIYRIIAIGDSYTYGSDVAASDSFPAQLGKLLEHSEVLNMGVPGYGIGQAYLKYSLHGKRYAPDVVVFGIYPSDYIRTGLSFTASAKPVYQSSGKMIGLSHYPVDSPEQQLERIRKEARFELRSIILLNKLWLHAYGMLADNSAMVIHTDTVITYLLKTLKAELDKADSILLVIQIPKAETFLRSLPSHEQAMEHLETIYNKLGVAYIDIRKELQNLYAAEYIFKNFYVQQGDGHAGHLSPRGNAEVARLIAARIKQE